MSTAVFSDIMRDFSCVALFFLVLLPVVLSVLLTAISGSFSAACKLCPRPLLPLVAAVSDAGRYARRCLRRRRRFDRMSHRCNKRFLRF